MFAVILILSLHAVFGPAHTCAVAQLTLGGTIMAGSGEHSGTSSVGGTITHTKAMSYVEGSTLEVGLKEADDALLAKGSSKLKLALVFFRWVQFQGCHHAHDAHMHAPSPSFHLLHVWLLLIRWKFVARCLDKPCR